MSGLEATARIRAAGFKMPIIGVTGNALEDDIREFIDAGAVAILTKPVARRLLEEKLGELNLL